jgi:hypothetical protein
VNGIVGGNATVGFAGGSLKERLSYEAPATIPSPDRVTVSIEVNAFDGTSGLLAGTVHIVPTKRAYKGDMTFENTNASTGLHAVATAHLLWTPKSITATAETYEASGTVEAALDFPNCDALYVNVPIGGGTLVYYTAASPVFANQHVVAVGASGSGDFMCGTPRAKTTKAFVMNAPISNCKQMHPAPNRDSLTGYFTCPDPKEEASWTFNRAALP